MPTPLADLLAQVPSLNDPAQPYVFEVDGNRIVGRWDVVRAVSLYPTEATAVDKKFSVTVEFDEGKGTYKSKDRSSDSGAKLDGGGLSFGTNSFSGKKTEKSFSFEFGGANVTKDGMSPVLAYSFDTAKIKDPLFAFLEKNGWKKKRGLFG